MDTHPESRSTVYQALTEQPETPTLGERRKRPRAEVHWRVVFSEPVFDTVLQTVTHDLSSSGFYCLVNAAFMPGKTHECTIIVPVPAHPKVGGQSGLLVHCKVRVSRVVAGDGGLSGVAFQIQDYRLRRSFADRDSIAPAPSHPGDAERK
jgi:hypothetical protein